MRILLTTLFMTLFLVSTSYAEASFFESALSHSDYNVIAHHSGHGGHGPHGDGCGR